MSNHTPGIVLFRIGHLKAILQSFFWKRVQPNVMSQPNGKFVISLDFELYWGIRDKKSLDEYGPNILGVRTALPRMLDAFDRYQTHATFATVGLLFASRKEELFQHSPAIKPIYEDPNLSPYNGHFETVKESEEVDPYHFASSLIDQIQQRGHHEIGTHTFSHYYCLEKGQTVADFKRDIESAVSIARLKNVSLKSLVFPRNQFNQDYLEVCLDHEIVCYRGNEKAWFYKAEGTGDETLLKKLCRMADNYINLSGHNCATESEIASKKPFNIPSSRFLRPYSPSLKILEGLRLKRIKDGMTYAAKTGNVYHLWWHPHNFGTQQEENFAFLESVLSHYQILNKKNNFTSITMSDLATQLENRNGN